MKQVIGVIISIFVIVVIHDVWISISNNDDQQVCYNYYAQYGSDFSQCEIERQLIVDQMWLFKHF